MAYDSTHGAELWSDDVATGTTQLVKDIDPGPGSSDPHDFVAFEQPALFRRERRHEPPDQPALDLGRHGRDHLAGRLFLARARSGVRPSILRCVGPPRRWARSSCSRSMTASTAPPSGRPTGPPRGPISFRTSTRRASPSSTGRPIFLGSGQASHSGSGQTNGTSAGTSEVKDLSQYGAIRLLRFELGRWRPAATSSTSPRATASGGVDLWASDGTAVGTSLVKDFTAPRARRFGVHTSAT